MSDQLGFDFTADPPAGSDQPNDVTDGPLAKDPLATDPLEGPANAPQALTGLRELTGQYPLRRKLLIGSTRGEGRELLRHLTRSGTNWVGWEATTLGPLAAELAGSELAARGLSVIDDFDFSRLVDAAIDGVLVDREVNGFSELAESLGFRKTVRSAVAALRGGGISPTDVGNARFKDRVKRRVLADILRAYEALLARDDLADPALVLGLALEALGNGKRHIDGIFVILPGLNMRGLSGRLVQMLIDQQRARCVATDPVVGLSVPKGMHWRAGPPMAKGSFLYEPGGAPDYGLRIDVFSATTVSEELREVLRRVVASGRRWDEVEIVTPDPQAYGSALHVLCESLDVPVTFGTGLPIERTRPGRVVTEFFRWLDSGFSADVIRGLLEAGDLRPPAESAQPSPMELSRAFRELRVGWGRERYLQRIDRRLAALDTAPPDRHESRSDMERRRGRARDETLALRTILAPVLETIPDGVPDPASSPGSGPVLPAALARSLGHMLDHVDLRDAPDETAMARIRQVLSRARATLTRPSEYRAAAAIVRGALDIRVPSPREDGKAPWSTRHGHLHLTDIDHGGRTGRALTFIVGMDSGRFPGSGRQDPLLLDRERLALAENALPTSAERLIETTFGFARLVARLRGEVTVSYATWEPAEAKELAPSTDVLSAFRLASGQPDALFETLRGAVGSAAGIVPADVRLDGQDVWMAALFEDGRPLDGRAVVADAFPHQARGALAVDSHRGRDSSSWVGRLEARPELDPRRDPGRLLSASALEALGSCPRRYLFRDVLKLRPPQDPPYDPDRWLTPLERGGLLHRVYERTLRTAGEEGIEAHEDAFVVHALRILRRETDRARDLHPTPSREVQVRELHALQEDVRSFVTMVRARGVDWRSLERRFGFDEEPSVEIRLYEGTLQMRGAIDRIDDGEEGLLVVDYKTGSAYSAEGDTGTFNGGRRLQNIIYTMVARELEGEPVARMEYHYATRKARNSVLGFSPEQLKNGPFLIDRMLDGVSAGAFPATDDDNDCRWCDYQRACRVRADGEGLDSPFATWTKRAMSAEDGIEAWLHPLRDVRGEEGPGIALPLEVLRVRE